MPIRRLSLLKTVSAAGVFGLLDLRHVAVSLRGAMFDLILIPLNSLLIGCRNRAAMH